MLSQEYDTMRQVEDDHWWYRALHGWVIRDLASAFAFKSNAGGTGTDTDTGAAMLDAGCGTGGLMSRVRAALPALNLTGLDAFPEAIQHTQARGFTNILNASVNDIPAQAGSYDAVTSLDVLYHQGVDDAGALQEFHRVLKPGGMLILNLPAFDALSGSHDVAVSGVRRYTTASLEKIIHDAQWEIKHLHYWNAWLFLPILVWRQWSRRKAKAETKTKTSGAAADLEDAASDLSTLPHVVNQILSTLVRLDMTLCRALCIPFGTSVYAVLIKRKERSEKP